MADAEYADHLALLTNNNCPSPIHAHSLEQANKSELICFKQEGNHLHSKWIADKVNGPMYLPKQLYLIYWKICQYILGKGANCFWEVVSQMEIWTLIK